MKEKENIQKIIIAMIQTVVVYFSASLTLTLITPNFKSNKDLLFVLLIHYIVFYLSDFYRDFWSRGYLEEFKMVLKYSFYYIFISSSLFFIFKNSFTTTRLSFFPFIAMNSILLYLLNSFLKYYRKYSYAKFSRDTKVVLITNKDSLSKMTFKNKYDHNYIAVCILDSSEKDCYDLKHNSLRIINKDALTSELTCLTVDQAFINIPIELFGKYQIQDIINDIEAMGVIVNVNVEALSFDNIGEKRIQTFEGYSVITYSMKFYKYSHLIAKRFLDIMGAIIGLLICGIVAIFLVPQIRKDGGPAIFSQNRVGRNGRIFRFYKFRSMRVDAEQIKKDLLVHNQMTGLMFKLDDDPRITKIGKFIRKTSIDELPQFYNVLKGDMSLVGTRPPTVDEYEKYNSTQKRRLSFKPGITGLWQISGRNKITDFDEIVKLDVQYINEWSIWSDIKIILLTLKVVLLGTGAK
ncbi:TPA: sugar transferase [Streptococcus agalactiae]